MSFPDPPPPPLPFMQRPYHCGDGGFWPQIPMNNESPDSHMQIDNAPAIKRPRNSDSNPPNYPNYPPMNPMMNKSNTPILMNPTPNLPLNKGTYHIFYKTRLCTRFMEGNCRNGDNCTFAHGHQDLRDPPPNWQELVREKEKGLIGDWNDDQRIITRMKICRKFYNGEECPYGEKCNFLHESPMKFRTDNVVMPRESLAISVGTAGPVVEQKNNNSVVVDQQSEFNKNMNPISDAFRMKPAYWKTKLCSKFVNSGDCPFGERCHFAHGQSELQAPVGGSVEANKVIPNIGSVQTRPLSSVPSTADTNLINNSIATVNAPTEEESENKSLLKWKAHRKLNRIYADWIDDDPNEAED